MEINYAKSSLTFTHLSSKEEREGGEELLRLKKKERKLKRKREKEGEREREREKERERREIISVKCNTRKFSEMQ